MVIVTIEDFNRACKVDVDVKQYVAPPELDADGNFIEKPLPPPVLDAAGNIISEGEEEPNVQAKLKAVDWADEVQVSLFGEGHIMRTRELLERQLEAWYQWMNTPEPPPPPKDPLLYIKRLSRVKEIEEQVAQALKEKQDLPSTKIADDRNFSENQHKAYVSWQDTDAYTRYRFLQEEYLESLKPPPPPRDWGKEYPGLLELQNEQFLQWYLLNRAYLENLLKPEIPVEKIPVPPPTPPPPPKDVNIYIRNMEKMREVENYWKENGPYVYWPVKYNPNTYFLELQRYWMGKWEYTQEYLILYRGMMQKKEKKIPWRKLKWWEWKPVSDIYKQEREPTRPTWDYGGLPKKVLSTVYRESEPGSPIPESQAMKPFKSVAYNMELAEEALKMIENRIIWEKEPRPLNMDAIYKETYEVIVKTQPNFI